jgi:hypothetical protein
MSGILGKYEWVAGMALDFGVPALGMAFGIPGGVSSFAVSALKKALGMAQSASEDDVKAKVDSLDPDTAKAAFQNATDEVTEKYQYLTRLAEVRGEVDKANISEVNETMRDEIGKVPKWHWRHLIGYIIGFHLLAFPIAVFAVVIFSDAEKTNAILNFPIVGILGIGAGLLGFVANDNTKKGIAAMTGAAPDGIVASTVRAVTGKKK